MEDKDKIALLHPFSPQKGVRPRLHSKDKLHSWVFVQDKVWVCRWGDEHEIKAMTPDYCRNVIGFCEARAEQIRFLILSDFLCQITGLNARYKATERVNNFIPKDDFESDAQVWLDKTPLLWALAKRATNERLKV